MATRRKDGDDGKLTPRKTVPHTPPQRQHETQDHLDVGGRVWKVGERCRVDGWLGDYEIRYFEGEVVSMFGGPQHHFRACRAERLRELGAVTKGRRTMSPRQSNWIRDAIAKDGRVEVPIPDDADLYALRMLKNQVFRMAYSLGLKGKFKLTVDKARGVVIGERKDAT